MLRNYSIWQCYYCLIKRVQMQSFHGNINQPLDSSQLYSTDYSTSCQRVICCSTIHMHYLWLFGLAIGLPH